MKLKWVTFISISLLLNAAVFAINPRKIEKELWSAFESSTKNTKQEVEALLALAEFYVNIKSDFAAADTLVEKSLKIAETTDDVAINLLAYKGYFDVQPANIANPDALIKADEVMQLAKNANQNIMYWHAYFFKAQAQFNMFQFKEALQSAKKLEEYTQKLKEKSLKIELWLLLGSCYEKLNNKKVALNYYLQALDLAKQSNFNSLEQDALEALAIMFHFNGNFDKALEYRQKKLDLYLVQPKIDSLQLLTERYYFIELGLLSKIYKNPEAEIDSLLSYTEKNGFESLNAKYWALYRSHLISNNNFEKLYTLYKVEYPLQLQQIKETDHDLYLRLNAYFYEYKQEIDTANASWQKVLANIEEERGLYFKSHRFLRYTEFLLRNGRIKDAGKYALAAYNVAKMAHYTDFQFDAMKLLEQIDIANNDYKSAYQHGLLRQALELDLLKSSKQEGLLVMELQHEVERREIIQKKEEEARKADMRATKIKTNALGLGLIVFLILSAFILRLYQITRKEKERSDDLLLNILPADTATELKNTGKTTAHQYTEVTVLFCDIVGFTLVAEKLSPQELVKEIDTYFSAFDDVITKHGMEKIKTVGDAYVAVGGMPLQNTASAQDVVLAAIEMQQRVHQLGAVRKAENRPAFTLRVGLNTGSVVAGVVGSKKFQYDIWGDAVNIAARMEQTSEPGHINISENTYQLVKNQFKCTCRGKLEAKNKGLMAMYFVEFELV